MPRLHALLLLLLFAPLSGCRDAARAKLRVDASLKAPPAPPVSASARHPEAEDDLDEDDMVALGQQIKRIEREGPLPAARLRELRRAARAAPPCEEIAADPERHTGRPYLARGRVMEMTRRGGGFTLLLALGKGESMPLLVSGAFAPAAPVRPGRTVEALGYLGGMLLYPLGARGLTPLCALAAHTLELR